MTLRALIWVAVSTQVQADEDKSSLPEQERQARELVEQNNWRMVEVLRVPGHSRRYIDIHEVNRDMLNVGIDAFARLMQHWEACDFDVLVVRDGSRFARSQTLHAYVVEKTIGTGARLYSLSDGWVDEQNYRMFIAMGGYSAASHVDHLVRAQRVAKDDLASRGLPHSVTPWFIHVERNEFGRALSLSIERSYQRLYDDLADLILAGIGWRHIERHLWERGHGRNGKAWRPLAMYHAVHHPYWWGHSARRFHHENTQNGLRWDVWVFDEEVPPPPETRMWRNTHAPVWEDELGDRVKAELRRRRMTVRGSARADRVHRFAGLIVCGYCGRYMVSDGAYSYRCQSKYNARLEPRCDSTRYIAESKVQAYIHDLLTRMIETADPNLLAAADRTENLDQRVTQISSEIAGLELQIRKLIEKQTLAPAALSDFYDEQLQSLAGQLDTLRAALNAAQRAVYQHKTFDSHLGYQELLTFPDLNAFWAASDMRVNQILHRLVGNRRLVARDGEISGTTATT